MVIQTFSTAALFSASPMQYCAFLLHFLRNLHRAVARQVCPLRFLNKAVEATPCLLHSALFHYSTSRINAGTQLRYSISMPIGSSALLRSQNFTATVRITAIPEHVPSFLRHRFSSQSHHNDFLFHYITCQNHDKTTPKLGLPSLCFSLAHLFYTNTDQSVSPANRVNAKRILCKSVHCPLQTIQFLCPTEQVHRNLLHFHSIAILCFSEAVQNFSGSGRSFSNTTIFLAIGFPYFASPCRNVTLLHLTPP